MVTVFLVVSIVSLAVQIAGVAVKAGTAGELVGALSDALDINNMSGLKLFDTPYMNITSNALIMIANFMYYAQLLVCICAFLCLIFNAFRLWSSTLEIKKFYVDTIYKCLIVMLLMNVYPTIVTKTYNFATELGVEASGGSDVVVTSFAKLAKQTKKIWQAGTESMVEQLQKGVGEDGKIIVNDKLIKTFTDYGMTEEEARAWAQQQGWELSDKNNKKKTNSKQNKAIKAFKNNTERKKYMKQSMAIVHAMSQVLTGTSESAMADGSISATEILNMGDQALDQVFYNPYIKGTKRLSFSAIMKTGVIIAECATAGALSSIDETDDSKQSSWSDLAKSKKPHLMFSVIGKFVMNNFIYKILMLIAIGYCMIEYIVTLVEYLIVAAVSSLLIPFFFIDATKQYAMNILKFVLSYFVKILVTTMMIFFVISMYIDLGTLIIARKDLDSIMSLLVYACITILGMVLVKNTGRIAGAVISGNPSMGLGDVVNQVRGMNHMAHHAAHTADRVGQQVQKAGQAAGQSVAAAVPAFQSAHAAKKSTTDSLRQSRDKGEIAMTDKDIKKAGSKAAWSNLAGVAKQGMADAAFKRMTGIDRVHNNDEAIKVGQTIYEDDGKARQATLKDVQNAAKIRSQKNADKIVEEMKKANAVKQAEDKKADDINERYRKDPSFC